MKNKKLLVRVLPFIGSYLETDMGGRKTAILARSFLYPSSIFRLNFLDKRKLKYMKKITTFGIVSIILLGLISTASASIDKNLKYGQRDKEVTELQEFLIDGGFLNGTPTTFFGLLTLKAVKAYQKSTSISPTGYVGILTRQKINDTIASDLASSTQAEVQETGTTTVIQNTNKDIVKVVTLQATTTQVVDLCKNIEGVQTKVPDGMFMNGDGICFTPVANQPVVNQQPIYQTQQPQTFSQNNTQTQQTQTVSRLLPTCTLSAEEVTVSGDLHAKIYWTSQNTTGGTLSITRNGQVVGGINLEPVSSGSESGSSVLALKTQGEVTKYTATFGGAGGEIKCETSLVTTFPNTVPQVSIGSDTPISPIISSPNYPRLTVLTIKGNNFYDANGWGWKNVDYSVVSDDFSTNDIILGNISNFTGEPVIAGTGNLPFVIKEGKVHSGKLKIIVTSATFRSIDDRTVTAIGLPLESGVIEIK